MKNGHYCELLTLSQILDPTSYPWPGVYEVKRAGDSVAHQDA